MAITVPTIGSEIDVVTFGKPVVDAVNLMTPGAWITATMLNSWVASSGRTIQYCKINNVVYVHGVMTGGALGTTAFNLPVGYRPSVNNDFAVVSNNAGSIVMGAVYVRSSSHANAGDVGTYFGGVTEVQMTLSFAT